MVRNLRRNPAILDLGADELFEKILGAAKATDPELAEWLVEHEEAIVPLIASRQAKKREREAAAAPKPAIVVPAPRPRAATDWTPQDAAAWITNAMYQLAGLPPPFDEMGQPVPDDVGFSAATDKPGRRWLDHAKALGPENLAPEYLAAGIEILRPHSVTQLARDDFDQAEAAIGKVTDIAPEQARNLLYVAPGSTAKRGSAEGEGEWEAGSDGIRITKTPMRRGFVVSNKVLQAAGFSYAEVRVAKDQRTGDFYWFIRPDAAARFSAFIADHYPVLAAAILQHAPVWVAQAPAPPPSPQAQTAQAPTLDPEKGAAEGVQWEWSPSDRRRVLFLFPGKDSSFFVSDNVKSQKAYRGYEYWKAFDTQDADRIAELLETGGDGRKYRFRPLTQAAAVIRKMAAIWNQKEEIPQEEAEARGRRARGLTRRFSHMLHPDVKADPTAADQAIAQGMPFLDKIKPGDQAADLGAWGSWKVADGVLYVYTPFGMGVTKVEGSKKTISWADVVRTYRRRPDASGTWADTFDLKATPAVARALDRISPPLAMSLRLGLLTEVLGGADRDCASLEDLASAKTVDEIADAGLRDRVRRIVSAIPWAPGIKLYPYQEVGVAYAVMADGKALIGDSMGLGKTPTAIGYLLTNIQDNTPALVIAPTTYNWRNEIERFTGGRLRGHIVSTGSQLPRFGEGDVALVSWGLVRTIYERLLSSGFKTVIADESHYAKNVSGRGEAARILAHAAPHRLLLSGTAMENRPIELWHQLYMVDPVTFPEKKDFGERFAAATKRTVRGPDGKTRTFMDDRGASNLDELRDILRCFMIRRTKSEVLLDLPDKSRVPLVYELGPSERRAYADVAANIDKAICAAWRQRSILKARKLVETGTPAQEAVDAVNREPPDAKMLSELAIVQLGYLRRAVAEAKIPSAVAWIEDFLTTENPLLIFLEHQSTLESLGRALNDLKVPWDFIDGSVSQKDRMAKVDAFQQGKIRVLVGSKAMAEGWNLTRASHVLFVERWWVPSKEEQAEDRAYRIGQKNAVTVYYLMAPGTVDDHIADLVDRKRAVIEKVMSGERVQQIAAVTEAVANEQSASLGAAVMARIAKRLADGGQCRITIKDLS
jgi:superfamily II DNA or RNA helicase